MTVEDPQGRFVVDDYDRPVCILARGIGITSVRAILRKLDISGSNPKKMKIYYLDEGGEYAFEESLRRIKNFTSRGIAKAPDQTFHELYLERQTLYRRHADLRVDGNRLGQEELAAHIADLYRHGA